MSWREQRKDLGRIATEANCIWSIASGKKHDKFLVDGYGVACILTRSSASDSDRAHDNNRAAVRRACSIARARKAGLNVTTPRGVIMPPKANRN